MNWKEVDMRDAFFNELYDLMLYDRNVILLTIDMGAMSLDKIEHDFPLQFINMGIAEQNAISVAAGLAITGKKVFVYGITSFTVLRCLEQIKIDICYMDLPVHIVGIGTGFTYGTDGPTHYAIEDIAIMNTLPNIEIYSPCDAHSTAMLTGLTYLSKKPTYIRIEKGKSEVYHKNTTNFYKCYETLKDGNNVIITTGKMIDTAFKLSEKLSNSVNDTFGVMDIYKLKPINDLELYSVLKNKKCIIVIEEHLKHCGLGSIILNFILNNDLDIPIKIFGVENKDFYEFKNRESILKNCCLDVDSIYNMLSGG